jgi:hypothetical protein
VARPNKIKNQIPHQTESAENASFVSSLPNNFMVISQHKFFIKQGPWHILTTTKGAGKNIILQFPHPILWSGKNKIKSISSQESTRGLSGRKIHTGNGIVEANELNVPAITARTAVSNKDSVERQLLAAKPNKPNPHWPFYSSHRSNKNILQQLRSEDLST